MQKIILIVVLFVHACAFGQTTSATHQAADFYVSPSGDDSAAGTIDAPLATLVAARDIVRTLKKTKQGGITVHLRGGRYEFSETAVFSLEDSGSENQTITYAAFPGETPVLSGGAEVSDWQKPKSPIDHLPENARGKVVVADVSKNFRALFDAEGILPRARSEMFVTVRGGNRTRVIVPESHYKQWSAPQHLEVLVRPHHAWIVNLLPVSSVDDQQRALNTSVPATYAMNPLHFLKKTPNAWVENAIEELDQPGEWVLDSDAGKLYLWPRNDSKVFHAHLNEVIRVEGKVDFEGAIDIPVTNLKFEGLTFQHGDRYRIDKDNHGVQHDWNFIDKDNALLRFRGTAQCEIANCHFLHSGSGAIRVDLHGMKNRITGNHIEHIGGSGIFLCGYGPGTKDVNRENFVSNNHVHHVGEIYWHSPGIHLSQSGDNQVSNNLIHHTNYTGLIVSGFVNNFFRKNGRESSRTARWQEIGGSRRALSVEESTPFLHARNNMIELNEIHHVMQKLGDGNAIYIRGAGSGNTIRRNYVHHLVTPMIMQCAIRTDGGQRDTLITENVIYKCMSQGMLLKLNNRFENNILVDVLSPPRGYFLSLREGPLTGTIRNNIFYASGDFDTFIHELKPGKRNETEDARGRPIARLQDARVDDNIYFSKQHPDMAEATLKANQEKGKDANGLVGDPLFVDLAKEDFRLKANSPALKLGFKQIDRSKIGLLK